MLFVIRAVSPPALGVSLRSVATSGPLGGLFMTDVLAPHYPKGSIRESGGVLQTTSLRSYQLVFMSQTLWFALRIHILNSLLPPSWSLS